MPGAIGLGTAFMAGATDTPTNFGRQGYVLALGLRRPLVAFAKSHGAIRYVDVYPDEVFNPNQFFEHMVPLMENARRIIFNMEGMRTAKGGVATIDDVLREGAEGLVDGNVTNWELYFADKFFKLKLEIFNSN